MAKTSPKFKSQKTQNKSLTEKGVSIDPANISVKTVEVTKEELDTELAIRWNDAEKLALLIPVKRQAQILRKALLSPVMADSLFPLKPGNSNEAAIEAAFFVQLEAVKDVVWARTEIMYNESKTASSDETK